MSVEQATITLGSKSYIIPAAPIKRTKSWRRRLEATLTPLLNELQAAKSIQFETPGDLLQLVPLVNRLLIDSLDDVIELVITYSSILEADRDFIEENATDKQIFAAFLEVLRLTDPFGLTGRGLRLQLSGLTKKTTAANSPSPSGDSASTSSTPSPTTS